VRALTQLAAVALGLLGSAAVSLGQASSAAATLPVTPPSLLVLVHQEVQPGKDRERQKLESSMSLACYQLGAPSFWLNLRALSGYRESVILGPFDSFEDWERSRTAWNEFYAVHPEVSGLRDQIDQQIGNERTAVAIRRADLGYLPDNIDLSQTRFVRMVEVRLFPGRENSFVEAVKTLAEAHTKVQAEIPWVVYQLNAGMVSPTFVLFMPTPSMAKNDDILSSEQAIARDLGVEVDEQLKTIARDSYVSADTTLYEVMPGMSHVTKDFADSDPGFWRVPDPPDAALEHKRYGRSVKKLPNQKVPAL
jgi:hypothetical protein